MIGNVLWVEVTLRNLYFYPHLSSFLFPHSIFATMQIGEITDNELVLMGHRVLLLPQAALYFPDRNEMMIADLHLGKAEHFRKNGIPLPGEITTKDVDILTTLICEYMPAKVILLGDLFHSDHNDGWIHFRTLVDTLTETTFTLVKGNHDILDTNLYQGMEVVDSYEIGNILCTHEPLSISMEDRYNLCGHIHPGVKLKGKGRQALRLPCFYFGIQQGILPAFGSFTGLYTIKPKEGDKVYIIANDEVKKVT